MLPSFYFVFSCIICSFSLILGIRYLIIQCRNRANSCEFYPLAEGQKMPEITIVVVCRNEEENVESLLQSLLSQVYPAPIHIFLFDDFSTDRTLAKMKELQVLSTDRIDIHIFTLSEFDQTNPLQANKKWAIAKAVQMSKDEIIVCTDADCVHHPYWAYQLCLPYTSDEIHFVTGAVTTNTSANFWSQFQALELLGMSSVTEAGLRTGHYINASGANMSFRRTRFMELNPYQSNYRISSGDDVFLVESFQMQNPGSCFFQNHNNALVFTKPMKRLLDFVSQRIRWAGKTASMQSITNKKLALEIFLFHLLGFLLLLMTFYILSWGIILIFHLLFKLVADIALLKKTIKHYKFTSSFLLLICMCLVHFFYIIGIGFLSLFQLKVRWKDRWIQHSS